MEGMFSLHLLKELYKESYHLKLNMELNKLRKVIPTLNVLVIGDIILDADGADVIFKDSGTAIGTFTNSSSDFVITSNVQDKDILFKWRPRTKNHRPLTPPSSSKEVQI